jgi:hypothetical protein
MPIQLTFMQRYDMEASFGSTAFDGGVLEISIDGGAFSDVIDAGGNFTTGGYNKVISSQFDNPLAGRSAWSGNSGSFIRTALDLPAAALGHDVQLKWRCGSDGSTGAGGWYVDDVAVGAVSCCVNPPSISIQPQSKTVLPGASALFKVTAMGSLPLSYQWRFDRNELSGATETNYFIAAAQPSDLGCYDVVITNTGGSITSSVAILSFVAPPILVDPLVQTNGQFSFILTGDSGFNYLIESSTNLSNWSTLGTVTNATGQVPFSDTNLPLLPTRTYRAKVLPPD